MLLGGPAAALAFGLGVTWLGAARPGYSAVRQTVSELGPQGGKGRGALAALNLIIALAAVVFACGLGAVASEMHWTMTPAYFVGFYAALAAGLAAFPSGHRLHNLFGLCRPFRSSAHPGLSRWYGAASAR